MLKLVIVHGTYLKANSSHSNITNKAVLVRSCAAGMVLDIKAAYSKVENIESPLGVVVRLY